MNKSVTPMVLYAQYNVAPDMGHCWIDAIISRSHGLPTVGPIVLGDISCKAFRSVKVFLIESEFPVVCK